MAKTRSLGSQDDVAASRKAAEQSDGTSYLKIPDKRTPWYLLSLDFVDGFTHFYEGANGRVSTVSCGGGEDGKGFAVDECPLCALMLERYQRAKQLGEKKGAAIKKSANDIRASYQAKFVAIRGDALVNEVDGRRVYTPTFVIDDDDEESTVAIGVLSLSQAQFTGLTDMIEDEDIPWIKSGDDLGNRVIWTTKRKKNKKSRYKEVFWSAAKKRSDTPEAEIPEDIDFDKEFVIDEEALNKAYEIITGKRSNKVADDEEVEVEGDEVEEEIYDDSADVEADYLEDDVEGGGEEEAEEEEDVLSDVEDEDDFVDDDPEEVTEEEADDLDLGMEVTPKKPAKPPKPTRAKPTAKKPVSKAPAKKPAARKPAAKKSGKKSM